MFGDFQYTTMRKEMPLQNALFLLIPVSYVAGWTLDRQAGVGASRKDTGIWRAAASLQGAKSWVSWQFFP
jgi:hypothetical protein